MEQSVDFPHRYPTLAVVRYPQPRITSHKLLHKTRLFLQHYLPAQLIDVVMRCARRKPFAARLYNRLSYSMDLLEFFATNEWVFENTNTQRLFEGLHPDDKRDFNFDVRTIDWPSYVQTYCYGIRLYILKEDLTNLEAAKMHLRRMKYMKYASRLVLAAGAWKVCCSIMPCEDLIGIC